MGKGVVLLCAGGTGGHLFPAQALAHELAARGWQVHLATDERAQRYSGAFPAEEIHIVPSGTFGSRNPLALARAALRLLSGYLHSWRLVGRLRPAIAVGFGGYPTLPPILAARHRGVPVLLHDANAVLGRANRWLARRADLLAMGFAGGAVPAAKAVITGNPVRPDVIKAAKTPYPGRSSTDPFRLLVFGGSQGARFFSEALPSALAQLDQTQRGLLDIVQQARPEDAAELENAYHALGLKARIASFFDDMPAQISQAHLVISRAGASTVSELSAIGRPSILVPFPFALDHDQAMNAATLAGAGGARVIAQADLSPQILADLVKNAMNDAEGLAQMAQKAKESGKPDAAARLADCAEQLARAV